MSDALQHIAETFTWLSLLQFGGTNAVIPEIHRQAVDVMHWMDAPTFGRLFALAQLAPGPALMIVSLIGWHVAGLAGLVTATLCTVVPPCTLAFVTSRIVRRAGQSRWIAIVKDGLVPLAIGMILASGAVMVSSARPDMLGIAITVAATLFVAFTDYNLLWAIGGAILIGLAANQF
jgi:chromate transporter